MLAKKTSKNQITLPKAIANAFPETDYFEISIADDKILLVPVKIMPVAPTLESIRQKMKRLGVTEKDIEGAVRWARNRKK